MSRHFAFSQVIAIGQPFMPNARQFQLRTPAIDALATHAVRTFPAIQDPVQELNGLLMVLAQAAQSSQFAWGTLAQRQAWGLFWQAHAQQLQQYVQVFTTARSSLTFTEWMSRQPLPEHTWRFLSMSLLALSSVRESQQNAAPTRATAIPEQLTRPDPIRHRGPAFHFALTPDFILVFPS